MNHLILTETTFFKRIRGTEQHHEPSAMQSEYENFIGCVTGLCCNPPDSTITYIALSYAEVELQHIGQSCISPSHEPYAGKALAFVRKMLEYVSRIPSPMPPLSSIPPQDEKKNNTHADAPPMRWTGSTVDLIELLYGLDTLKCINEGETGMGELLGHFSRIFGLEIKDSQCYNTYAAIKGRKNDSRTYFFDRASEKLNRRMERDEERERMRR